MINRVLIADDDQALLSLLKQKLDKYKNDFSLILVKDGAEAAQMLKETSVSLVVTDLQMPKMDGFGLLAHISENYPEIPVIVMTAHGKAKTEVVVKKGGASHYVQKPLVMGEFARIIISTLKQQSEGGTLNNVSLEMFIQLIEMEMKTCTIRVFDKVTRNQGVLFFKDGELLNARCNDVKGNDAANFIFSWSSVTLSISNTCAQKKREIQGDLQAILLEAMRLKDEAAEAAEEAGVSADGDPGNDSAASPPVEEPAPSLSSTEICREKLIQMIGDRGDEATITSEPEWQKTFDLISAIGNNFQAGKLMACFISKKENTDYLLVSGETPTQLTVSPKWPREKLIRAFSE